MLVTHGPLNRELILAKVPLELRERTNAIAELQPLNKSARAEFRALVDAQLAPLCPRPADDVQQPGGAEELTIDRWVDGADYVIAVHAYAADGDVAASGARVQVTRGGSAPLLLHCPTSGSGRYWYVANVGADRQLNVLNELRAE